MELIRSGVREGRKLFITMIEDWAAYSLPSDCWPMLGGVWDGP